MPTQNQSKILNTEQVLHDLPNNDMHEGQISLTHGFIPYHPLKQSLPPAYQAWDEIQNALPKLLAQVAERKAISELPFLDASDEEQLPNEYLSRAASILGNLAHAYYFNNRLGSTQEEDPLPLNIRTPWEQVNKRLGRQFGQEETELKAFRSCYDIFLSNFKFINSNKLIDGGENNLTIQGKDLDLINYATGTQAERGNNITFILAELRFAVALGAMLKALRAAATNNDDEMIEALKTITHVIEKISETLDYLIPNQHSEHYVDQVVWTKTVATFDGRIPGGHLGLSGSEFPMFQTMDIFFERPSYETPFGKAFAKKYETQPRNISNFLDALRMDIKNYSLQSYAENSKNIQVTMHYQAMVDTFWNFMSLHRSKAFGYMQINFLNGRPVTNGGNSGEKNIYQQLKLADEERASNYHHLPYYATKVSERLLGTNASEFILNPTDTGFNFNPGDRCMVIPENSSQQIDFLLKKHKLDQQMLVSLNERWKSYLKENLGVIVDELTLSDFLKYTALDEINEEYLSSQINSDLFYPIRPRQYSQAPMENGMIRLTVGHHSYEQDGHTVQGIASGYLKDKAINDRVMIKKVNARNFHLPDDKETPILVFAAGTGIAPFIGFKKRWEETANAQKNWLFYSVRDQDSYFYSDELQEANDKDQLNLLVAFTRSKDPNQKSKRVNDLINEQAEAIASMITEQGAHIFVCGSSGFADTVMESIIKALKNSELKNAERYVDTMVADHRYKIDLFTQHRDEEYPEFYPSEIARHNKPDDCWGIINKTNQAGKVIARNVYDWNKSKFKDSHPGGQKILLVNAGTDGTSEYNNIGHQHDQQIEAMLMNCKIGVIAIPEFETEEEKTIYNTTLSCLELLTKIENNLWISNELFLSDPAPYLWRNTLIGFLGRDSDGSLQAALKLFENLSQLANRPKQDLNPFYEQLSQLAVFIFEKTQTPEQPNEIQQLRCIYEAITARNTEFVKNMKEIMCDIAQSYETKTHNTQSLEQALQKADKLIKGHMAITEHFCKPIGNNSKAGKKQLSFFESAAVCPFISSRNKGVISKPQEKSDSNPAPQAPINNSWCSLFAKAAPIVTVAAGVAIAVMQFSNR